MKERWTLALDSCSAARMLNAWLDRDMPCDMQLRRAKEQGFCCLIVDIEPTEYKTVQMLADVIRMTGCRVHKKTV